MPVTVKEASTEETQQIKETQQESRENIANKLMASPVFKSLEIPKTEGEEEVEEVEQEQPVETNETEEQEEEQVEEETTEEQQQEETEEEVVPKSKIQPRIDKLTSENKALKSRLDALEIKQQPADETTTKLEKMSSEELKSLKRQVRVAELNAKDDHTKLNELLDLEDKIDQTISEAPAKFQQAQVTAFNRAAEELAATDIFDEKDTSKILESAKQIYSSYPKLQKDVDGQAMALKLAAEHVKALKTVNGSKQEVSSLKSKVNMLKKKTSLDTRSTKNTVDTTKFEQLRKTAMTGTQRDKHRFVRDNPAFNVDAMIPSEFK